MSSDEAGAVLEQLSAANPGHPELLARLGLLDLCRSDGPDEAYGLVEDQQHRGDPVLGLPPGEGDARSLALARLRAGLRADEGSAHLGHALAALAAGADEEA